MIGWILIGWVTACLLTAAALGRWFRYLRDYDDPSEPPMYRRD